MSSTTNCQPTPYQQVYQRPELAPHKTVPLPSGLVVLEQRSVDSPDKSMLLAPCSKENEQHHQASSQGTCIHFLAINAPLELEATTAPGHDTDSLDNASSQHDMKVPSASGERNPLNDIIGAIEFPAAQGLKAEPLTVIANQYPMDAPTAPGQEDASFESTGVPEKLEPSQPLQDPFLLPQRIATSKKESSLSDLEHVIETARGSDSDSSDSDNNSSFYYEDLHGSLSSRSSIASLLSVSEDVNLNAHKSQTPGKRRESRFQEALRQQHEQDLEPIPIDEPIDIELTGRLTAKRQLGNIGALARPETRRMEQVPHRSASRVHAKVSHEKLLEEIWNEKISINEKIINSNGLSVMEIMSLKASEHPLSIKLVFGAFRKLVEECDDIKNNNMRQPIVFDQKIYMDAVECMRSRRPIIVSNGMLRRNIFDRKTTIHFWPLYLKNQWILVTFDLEISRIHIYAPFECNDPTIADPCIEYLRAWEQAAGTNHYINHTWYPKMQYVPSARDANDSGVLILGYGKSMVTRENFVIKDQSQVEEMRRTIGLDLLRRPEPMEFGAMQMTSGDWESLYDGQLVNDVVLDIFFKLLMERSEANRSLLQFRTLPTSFSRFLMSGNKEMETRDELRTKEDDFFNLPLLVPIGTGNHWVLYRIEERESRIRIFDSQNATSLETQTMETFQRVKKWLNEERTRRWISPKEWDVGVVTGIPKQPPGSSDSALYVCGYAESLARNKAPRTVNTDSWDFRRLLRKGFIPVNGY